jgi:hypothetical protein
MFLRTEIKCKNKNTRQEKEKKKKEMYIMYSCQMSHYGKNKFLINQSVGEEK